ncbi:Arylsulfatase [Beggiatoa sp. PS]|nr:Arylsulfatase [Beggiatoa sp. PS]
MKSYWHLIMISLLFSVNSHFSWASPGPSFCGDNPLALQILGSGGPIADDGRAATGYLLWIHGKSRLMLDAGGGTFLRFGEAKARIEEFDLLAISHFHTDHVADLPAILKGGFFSNRHRALELSGPSGNFMFPDTHSFIEALFKKDQGAFHYLSDFLEDDGSLFPLNLTTIDIKRTTPTVVFQNDEMKVSALGVPHGIVPSLAYRVDIGDKSLIFGSDQNGSNPAFIAFATGADVLIAHFAIPENAGRVAKRLHAIPSVIGKLASDIQPSILILSHFMKRSLKNLNHNLSLVKKQYAGQVILATDLQCIPLN